MAKKISRSELGGNAMDSVPTYQQVGTHQVGTRLEEIADLLGERKFAAKVAGADPDSLRRWISGESKAPFLPLARLCQAAGRSLDWLATGIEPPYNSTSNNLDETALAWALKVVDEVGAGLPMEKRVRLVRLAYSLYIRSGSPPDLDSLKELVREALSQTM